MDGRQDCKKSAFNRFSRESTVSAMSPLAFLTPLSLTQASRWRSGARQQIVSVQPRCSSTPIASAALQSKTNLSRPAELRALLAKDGIIKMPCCYDALSARLIERAGFELTFMSGFSTAAAKVRTNPLLNIDFPF